VSTNGYVVLWPLKPTNVAVLELPPGPDLGVPILAPFWANITTDFKVKSKRHRPKVKVYSGKKVAFVDRDIKRKFSSSRRYTTRNSFIVKWDKVTYVGGTDKSKVWILVFVLL